MMDLETSPLTPHLAAVIQGMVLLLTLTLTRRQTAQEVSIWGCRQVKFLMVMRSIFHRKRVTLTS